MARRVIKKLTWFSALMLAASSFLLLASHIESFSHRRACISLSDSFHIGVRSLGWGWGWDSRLVFYNVFDYGPYRGSIIMMRHSDGSTYPPLKRRVNFGDSWGIYYRYFSWKDATPTLWTLAVSLWYPIALFSIVPAVRVLHWTFRSRNRSLW